MKSLKSWIPFLLLVIFCSATAVAANSASMSASSTVVAQPKGDTYKWKIKKNASKTDMQKIAADLKTMGCNLVVSKLEYEGKKIKNIAFEIKTADGKKVSYKMDDMKKPICIELIQKEGKTVSIKAGPC